MRSTIRRYQRPINAPAPERTLAQQASTFSSAVCVCTATHTGHSGLAGKQPVPTGRQTIMLIGGRPAQICIPVVDGAD
jgi:hypothetical protein